MEIKFKYALGERVFIVEIERPGRVEAAVVDHLGVQFRVAYWDNSERRTAWVHEDELRPIAR